MSSSPLCFFFYQVGRIHALNVVPSFIRVLDGFVPINNRGINKIDARTNHVKQRGPVPNPCGAVAEAHPLLRELLLILNLDELLWTRESSRTT